MLNVGTSIDIENGAITAHKRGGKEFFDTPGNLFRQMHFKLKCTQLLKLRCAKFQECVIFNSTKQRNVQCTRITLLELVCEAASCYCCFDKATDEPGKENGLKFDDVNAFITAVDLNAYMKEKQVRQLISVIRAFLDDMLMFEAGRYE